MTIFNEGDMVEAEEYGTGRWRKARVTLPNQVEYQPGYYVKWLDAPLGNDSDAHDAYIPNRHIRAVERE